MNRDWGLGIKRLVSSTLSNRRTAAKNRLAGAECPRRVLVTASANVAGNRDRLNRRGERQGNAQPLLRCGRARSCMQPAPTVPLAANGASDAILRRCRHARLLRPPRRRAAKHVSSRTAGPVKPLTRPLRLPPQRGSASRDQGGRSRETSPAGFASPCFGVAEGSCRTSLIVCRRRG